MKEASMFLLMAIMLTFDGCYIYQIWRRKIDPTLSMWIIFLLGTGLSLATYSLAEKFDFQSGILNTLDFVSVALVLCAILIWGKRTVRFRSHERWYLAGIALIVMYGILTGNMWNSNIYTQVLICCGYIPLMQTFITEKRNTEPFLGWVCALCAGIVGLYPAIGNTLATIYSLRTIGAVLCILCLMTYYEFFSPPTSHR